MPALADQIIKQAPGVPAKGGDPACRGGKGSQARLRRAMARTAPARARVEVTQPDGTKLDVKVDAGNATVLAKDVDDDSGDSAATHSEANDGTDASNAGPATAK